MKRILALIIGLAPLTATAATSAAVANDDAACSARLSDTAAKAKSFQGEDLIKQLIFADLRRATKEQAEGDADECLEALDHAGKLLRGEY
jgi:hypothetical protein